MRWTRVCRGGRSAAGEGPGIGAELPPKTHQPVIVRNGAVPVAACMREAVAPIAGPMSAGLEQFVSYARTNRTEENLPGQDGRGRDLDPEPVDINSALASGELVCLPHGGKKFTPQETTPGSVVRVRAGAGQAGSAGRNACENRDLRLCLWWEIMRDILAARVGGRLTRPTQWCSPRVRRVSDLVDRSR
jgi:hypothetical protein